MTGEDTKNQKPEDLVQEPLAAFVRILARHAARVTTAKRDKPHIKKIKEVKNND